MKKLIHILGTTAFIATIAIVTSTYADSEKTTKDESKKKNDIELEKIIQDHKRHMGYALEEEQQEFENTIKDLLFITTDDIHRHGFGKRVINMSERKRYFNDEGWQNYLEYVTEHKNILKKKSEIPLNSKAYFIYGSQKYTNDQNKTFSAKGVFQYAAYDAYRISNNFELSTTYSITNIEDISDLKIKSWSVVISPYEKEGNE